MPSLFFDQNMQILKSAFPKLAEELGKVKAADNENNGTSDDLIIETASCGAPTLLIRRKIQDSGGNTAALYIHSKRDPEREAERIVEGAGITDDINPVLVLGFGLGYVACALVEGLSGDRPVIIVEKRPEILKKALETRDLRKLLTRERLVFVLSGDGEGVTGALSLFESTPGVPPPVIQNRALTGLDEEWYAVVEEKIKTWTSRTNVNRATQNRFGKRWVRNLSKNLEAVRDRPGISALEGLLSGNNALIRKNITGKTDFPVFLAAAGPTLDAAGPILDEIYKRCVVVAVDTSLRFLIARGIDPDFLVSVDPQYWNFRHLDRAPAPKTRLIAESAVYPPVLRHSLGGIFLCGSLFPLGRYIEERVDPKGELGAGGSVATSAWDFIRHIGGRTVWIAGLDLSFPELKTHYSGAVFEEKSHLGSRRFSPAETWNFRALRDGQPFPAKKRGGGTILTDKRLSLYAAWFESRFSQYPEFKNFSLSADGLELKGLETASVEELIALPERREEIDFLLSEAYFSIERDFNSEIAKKTRTEKYENARNIMLKDLSEIKSLAQDTAESAGKAVSRQKQGRLSERERENTLRALDAANKTITESTVKEIAGFIFPETGDWEEKIAATTTDPLTRHLEYSARFYRALYDAAQYNILKLLN